VPVGIPGELLVGGVGVARVYLNRQELTAEKFVPDLFADLERQSHSQFYPTANRLYRTGDLVRYRQDGNIEFLGRIDQQVKVRGFRIELGEIESALHQFSEAGSLPLREAIVLVREDIQGDKRLVAYVSPDTSTITSSELSIPSAASLKSYLRQVLPEYMVPSAYVVLETVPLTPSGKVDRRALAALPAPETGRQALQTEYIAPRNPTEMQLADICATLLNIPKVGEQSSIGVNDNFFELGGHSLLATQFISRVRENFQVELPLRTLFEHPTIGELAFEIEKIKAQGEQEQVPTIQRVSRDARRMKRSDLDE
jgi:acyl carrier protein